MCEVTIRRSSAEDTESIVYIEKTCFAEPRSAKTVLYGIEAGGCFSWTAIKDGKTVGYLAASLVIDEYCIERVAVLPEAQSCGIGTALLKAAMAEGYAMGAEMMYLEVREKNAHAIAMYTAAGFENVGFRKNYYGVGEHAIVMVKKDKILPK